MDRKGGYFFSKKDRRARHIEQVQWVVWIEEKYRGKGNDHKKIIKGNGAKTEKGKEHLRGAM